MTQTTDLPVIVYRGWQVSTDGEWLYGQYKATSEWARGDTTATCELCKDCPGADCECGLHGYCSLPQTWINTKWITKTRFSEVSHYFPHILFGAALLWGPMHVGTKDGIVRAKYGTVLALLDMGSESRRVAKAYRVPTIENEHLLQAYAREHGEEIPIPKEPT